MLSERCREEPRGNQTPRLKETDLKRVNIQLQSAKRTHLERVLSRTKMNTVLFRLSSHRPPLFVAFPPAGDSEDVYGEISHESSLRFYI